MGRAATIQSDGGPDRHAIELFLSLLQWFPCFAFQATPVRYVKRQYRLEQAAMIANPEMKQLVHDYEILKRSWLFVEACGER